MTLTARSAPRLVGGTSSRLDRVFPAWAFTNGRFLANSFQHTITARRCRERHPRARRAFRGKDLPDGELRYVGSIPSAALFGGRSGYLGAWLCFREKARQLEVDLAGVSPCDARAAPGRRLSIYRRPDGRIRHVDNSSSANHSPAAAARDATMAIS